MSKQKLNISEARIRCIVRKILKELKFSSDPILSFISQVLDKPINSITLIQEDDIDYDRISKLFKKTSQSQYLSLPDTDLDKAGIYCTGNVENQRAVMTNISGYCVFYM